jgi:hypothetical protein
MCHGKGRGEFLAPPPKKKGGESKEVVGLPFGGTTSAAGGTRIQAGSGLVAALWGSVSVSG